MSYRTNSDNIFAPGAFITAKENPSLKLKIKTYYHRIYYCEVVGDEQRKQLAYFERELMPPVNAEKKQTTLNTETKKL